MSRKRVKNWLIYRFVLFEAFCVGRMPRGAALKTCGFFGLIAFRVVRKARQQTEQNLSRAFGWSSDHPRLARTAREVFVNAGKNLADLILLPRLNAANVHQLIKVSGRHHIDEALALGRGLIGITGHIGNWELMAAGLALQGYPLNAVARQVYDQRLDRILNDLRKNANVRGISRDTGVKEMIRVLRKGEILGILMDQDSSVRGVFVPFFDRPAHTPAGPVMLAMKTGAPILPMAIHRQRDETYLVTVKPPLDMRYTGDREKDLLSNTAACTRALESFIRQEPSQWVWMHNRWRKKLRKENELAWKEFFHVV